MAISRVNLTSSKVPNDHDLRHVRPILAELQSSQAAVAVYAAGFAWHCPVGPSPGKVPAAHAVRRIQTAHLAGLQRRAVMF